MSNFEDTINRGSGQATPSADVAQIQGTLRLLVEPGSIVELRVPGTHRGTLSGYFNDFHRLASTCARYSGIAPGIYITINPVNSDLLARAKNRTVAYAKHTTTDTHILRRRWILIDFDPVRPSGISSTDEEREAALDWAMGLQAFLVSLDFHKESMVLADSGNGEHLLLRVNLPNDAECTDLVEKCLQAVDLYFTDSKVQVDLTTFNAARLVMAQKAELLVLLAQAKRCTPWGIPIPDGWDPSDPVFSRQPVGR